VSQNASRLSVADGRSPAEDEQTGARLGTPVGWQRLENTGARIELAWPTNGLPQGAFRPTVSLDVEPAPGGPDAPAAHSHDTVDRLLRSAPGTHVLSLDLVTLGDGLQGRRLVAVQRRRPHTVQTTLWWTVYGGIATTVTATCAVEHVEATMEAIGQCVAGFHPASRLPHGQRTPRDTGEVPLDLHAAAAGLRLEELSWIRPAQPFRTQGPTLPAQGWGLLLEALRQRTVPGHRDEPARGYCERLVQWDLLSGDGRLTERGDAVAQILARPVAVLRADAGGRHRAHTLQAAIGNGIAAVLSTPGLGDEPAADLGGPGAHSPLTLDIVEPSWVPAAVASWAQICPAWLFGPLPEKLDRGRVMARAEDPSTPAPPQADPTLRAVWQQPWVMWGLKSRRGPGSGQESPGDLDRLLVLRAGDRGTFLIGSVEGDGSAVTIRPAPAYLLWRQLCRITYRARARE
jgi:hypothetical protein